MHGVECDNPIDGKFKSGGREKMAMWMMDTDYGGPGSYRSAGEKNRQCACAT